MMYSIWVTSNCNLNCRYCYEGCNKPVLNIDKQKAEEILSYIKKDMEFKDDELLIDFHGGEPFLNFNIIKFFAEQFKKEFKDKNLEFLCTSNMTILNDEILDFIEQNIPSITVSLDGSKKTHDFMRPFKDGRGSYDVVMKNAERLQSRLGDTIRVRMTFDTKTVFTLYDDIKHLSDMGFKTIVPAADSFDKEWDEIHIKELEKQINMVKADINSDMSVSLCEPLDYRGDNKCTGGIRSQQIYPDGSIYPCMMAGGVSEFKIGDIYEGIDNEKLKKILSYSHKENEECAGCGLKKCCDSARCKILNRLITGDFNTPSALECEINNLLYRINGIS